MRTESDRRSKAMTYEELVTLSVDGIRFFPIYQDGGYYSEYFRPGTGTADAWKAVRVAHRLGFPSGTTIYFTVDYDAYDFEVTNNILPYLAEVRSVLNLIEGKDDLPDYKLGVYGSRNTCIRAQADSSVHVDYSFLGNMSTGFSGNLGYSMPRNWSFNQFHETVIGFGLGLFGIDKNDYSGKDLGVSAVNPPGDPETSEEYETKHNAFVDMAKNIPVLQYFGPELFATNFNLDQSHRIAEIPNILTVDIEFNEQLSIPGGGEEVVTLQVTPSGVSGSLEGLLGGSMARFTQNRLGFYENFIDNIAASIGTGAIQLSIKGTGTDAELRITAFDEEIPTEGGGNLQLAVTVVITVDIDLSPVTETFTSESAKITGTVFGMMFLIFLAVKYGIAIIGGLTAFTLIALLIGDEEDIDDGVS